MSDRITAALGTSGCERLRDFAAVGPAQRAALELFVDRIRTADQQAEPVAWRIQRNDGAYELYLHKPSAERAADCYIVRPKVEPLYTAPPKAEPMSEHRPVKRVRMVPVKAASSKRYSVISDDVECTKGWHICGPAFDMEVYQ